MPRRPLDGARRITGDTASHAKYGVGPASDYGADMGEIIRAPIKGRITRWRSGTGGNSVGVTSTRWRITMQHLSAYAGGAGTRKAGAAVGYVGNTGTATTGPHLHTFVIDRWTGKRYSLEYWLTKFFKFKNSAPAGGTVSGPFSSSLAGGNLTPIKEPKKEAQEMYRAALRDTYKVAIFDSTTFFVTTDSSVDDNAWSRFVGKPGLTVSQAEWDSYEKVAAQNAAKIAATTTTIDYPKLAALIKVPTAIENGSAARAAIVKD